MFHPGLAREQAARRGTTPPSAVAIGGGRGWWRMAPRRPAGQRAGGQIGLLAATPGAPPQAALGPLHRQPATFIATAVAKWTASETQLWPCLLPRLPRPAPPMGARGLRAVAAAGGVAPRSSGWLRMPASLGWAADKGGWVHRLPVCVAPPHAPRAVYRLCNQLALGQGGEALFVLYDGQEAVLLSLRTNFVGWQGSHTTGRRMNLAVF